MRTRALDRDVRVPLFTLAPTHAESAALHGDALDGDDMVHSNYSTARKPVPPSNVTPLPQQRRCDDRVRSGPRAGRPCRNPATHFIPSMRYNVCGQHAECYRDATLGAGLSWFELPGSVNVAAMVRLEFFADDNARAFDLSGTEVAVVLRDANGVWRAFAIADHRTGVAESASAAVQALGFVVDEREL